MAIKMLIFQFDMSNYQRVNTISSVSSVLFSCCTQGSEEDFIHEGGEWRGGEV
jgi:hypothetical protein